MPKFKHRIKWLILGAFLVAMLGIIIWGYFLPSQPQPDSNSESQLPYTAVVDADDVIEFGNRNWLVLEVHENHALLITESTYIIDQGRYNNLRGGITWAGSTMRQYLNNEFFDSFSETERKSAKLM
jgi:hypothetical protein